MSLTVTGVGKPAATAGTGYASERYRDGRPDAWLNIGIAGHRDLATGTPVLASTVTDSVSGQVWRPSVNFNSGLVSLPLLTVDQPQDDYPDYAMIDMEAAGFFSSASTCASKERIHCLKIISDNVLSPSRDISKQTVIDLVSRNINVIDIMISHLQTHSGIQAASAT